jgi:hypothetical protein
MTKWAVVALLAMLAGCSDPPKPVTWTVWEIHEMWEPQQ